MPLMVSDMEPHTGSVLMARSLLGALFPCLWKINMGMSKGHRSHLEGALSAYICDNLSTEIMTVMDFNQLLK